MGIPVLPITNATVMGKMLLDSAIFMQASAAALVGAEAEKIQALVAAAASGFIEVSALTPANAGVEDTICCVKDLENAIINKVLIALSLIENGFPTLG